jgi:histidyl-tRNA synthetase
LRILDSKNPGMQNMIENAPKLMDCLGDETRAHFAGLCKQLDAAGIQYKLNSRLVRGLDYYNRTVFEWVTTKLGSQGTIEGGGRYDSLVQRLGGESTPACGFGIGLERVFLLMQEYGVEAEFKADAYLVNVGELAEAQAVVIAEQLRDAGLSVVVHAGGGSFKSQMKKADRSSAKYALILGDDEVQAQLIAIKPMVGGGEQIKTSLSETIDILIKSY